MATKTKTFVVTADDRENTSGHYGAAHDFSRRAVRFEIRVSDPRQAWKRARLLCRRRYPDKIVRAVNTRENAPAL